MAEAGEMRRVVCKLYSKLAGTPEPRSGADRIVWPSTCCNLDDMLPFTGQGCSRYRGRRSGFRPAMIALVLAWAALFQAACLFHAASPSANSMAVRQLEGEVRGFLALTTLEGALIADGDSVQVTHGNEITNRMTLHFKDGSLQEETVVFTQNGHFHLLTDHLVQKGPVFKQPIDLTIDSSTGEATVVYRDGYGEAKRETSRLQLPPDLANGLVSIVLKNLPPGAQSATASMVVATPKPLLIKLAITADGEDSFSTGATRRAAIRYRVKVDIGGIRGVLARLLGKQPLDTLVWVLGGDCPTYLKSEGQSFAGGPVWRMELVSPAWPRSAANTAARR